MLVGALDDAVKVAIIEDCAYQAAKSWTLHGLGKADAVDEIHDMAVCVGLGDSLGNDRLVAVIGGALERGELEREVVPDAWTNGHDKSPIAGLDEWDAGEDPGFIPPRPWRHLPRVISSWSLPGRKTAGGPAFISLRQRISLCANTSSIARACS
jgi:hypothetical protein